MTKGDTNKPKPGTHEALTKKSPPPSKGRSFCCSVFIYTFVFVSGVVVATILPDLAGHHFKQPYGKEYGAIAEQVLKDVPKHLTSLSETVALLGRDLYNRALDIKAQLEQSISGTSNKKEEKVKTKTATQRPASKAQGTN